MIQAIQEKKREKKLRNNYRCLLISLCGFSLQRYKKKLIDFYTRVYLNFCIILVNLLALTDYYIHIYKFVRKLLPNQIAFILPKIPTFVSSNKWLQYGYTKSTRTQAHKSITFEFKFTRRQLSQIRILAANWPA